MDKATTQTLARYTAATVLGLGGMAMAYPTLARPDVSEVLALCAKTGAIVATVSGAVVLTGFASHRIKLWASQRPPELRPAMLEALTHAAGPTLETAREALAVEQENELAAAGGDDLEAWKAAVTKFALLGNMRGFGYRDLKGLVDRPGWDTYKELLCRARVLENGAGKRPTQWAGEWSYVKLRVAIKWDRLQLPYPDGEPPAVRWVKGYSGTRNTQAKHASTQTRKG